MIMVENMMRLSLKKHRIELKYCGRCCWLARSGWMAQELLSTFCDGLNEVDLQPAKEGDMFEIRYNDTIIWSRKLQQ